MGSFSKGLSLLLVLGLAVSSLTIVKPGFAQAPTPSVPEFSLKYVDNSYYVPPTYGTDPYTGATVVTKNGQYVQNNTIDIIIKNQPFTPYSVNGSEINLFYQVQFKGHFAGADSWQFFSFDNTITPIQCGWYLTCSKTDDTIISVPADDYPVGAQVDFQVRALIGYGTVSSYDIPGFTDWFEFHGETSDWSNTQTVTIGESTPAPTGQTPLSSSPTPVASPRLTPTATNNQSVARSAAANSIFNLAEIASFVAVSVVVALLVVVIAYLRGRIRNLEHSVEELKKNKG